MKKSSIFILVCVILLSFCGCQKIEIDGVENFDEADSSMSLNSSLLPSEDFFDKFEYVDADYKYRAEFPMYFAPGTERSIVYVEYEAETYEQAKEFCFQEMMLWDNIQEYNGYTFIQNMGYNFPKHFMMFAYNDSNCRLVFIGLYTIEHSEDDAQEVSENWGDFVEHYFGDLYDWSDNESNDGSLS